VEWKCPCRKKQRAAKQREAIKNLNKVFLNKSNNIYLQTRSADVVDTRPVHIGKAKIANPEPKSSFIFVPSSITAKTLTNTLERK
jgi:hypothetical protein